MLAWLVNIQIRAVSVVIVMVQVVISLKGFLLPESGPPALVPD